MQNKPNLLAPQMNVNGAIKKDYENERLCRRRQNKPKQTQSNPIFKKSSLAFQNILCHFGPVG